jgi:hypothetical protein
MKRNPLFLSVLASALLFGLALSGCESPVLLEEGIGIIKLTNNSEVNIKYWSLEQNNKILWEERITISPGSSASHEIKSGMGIQVYLEDNDGDGWLSKNYYTVKKDKTIEIKFPNNFSPEQ